MNKQFITICNTFIFNLSFISLFFHNRKGPAEFLRFDPVQHPVVIQLGGNDPESIANAANNFNFKGAIDNSEQAWQDFNSQPDSTAA